MWTIRWRGCWPSGRVSGCSPSSWRADRLSRRLCTNVLVTVRSPDEAAATSYFATYRVDGWAGQLQPPPPPTQVGHNEDVFRRVDGVWLLASRTTVLAFGGSTPRADVPG